MQVFKAFTKIVLNRCFIALLYAGIFIAISFLITFNQSDAFDKFSGEKLTMTISDLDDTPESRELIDYLSKKNKVTVDSHPDNDKLLLNMFYQKTDFMLTIKEGYGSRISTGQTNDLFQCSYIEGSYAQSMAQNQIDKYVKTLTAYIKGGMDREIALSTASELMDTEADVTILGNETEKQGMTGSGKAFFRYMPYIFIGMMISTLVPALMIMNGKKIKARTNASCISPSKQFMGILLGTVIYAMVVWLIFMAAAAAMFGGELFQVRHVHHGVGRRLQIDGFCVGSEIGGDVPGADVDRGKFHAAALRKLLKEAHGSPVEVLIDDEVISLPEEIKNGTDGGHAARKGHGVGAVLEVCDNALELLPCGVGLAGVVKACGLPQPPSGEGGGLAHQISSRRASWRN